MRQPQATGWGRSKSHAIAAPRPKTQHPVVSETSSSGAAMACAECNADRISHCKNLENPRLTVRPDPRLRPFDCSDRSKRVRPFSISYRLDARPLGLAWELLDPPVTQRVNHPTEDNELCIAQSPTPPVVPPSPCGEGSFPSLRGPMRGPAYEHVQVQAVRVALRRHPERLRHWMSASSAGRSSLRSLRARSAARQRAEVHLVPAKPERVPAWSTAVLDAAPLMARIEQRAWC